MKAPPDPSLQARQPLLQRRRNTKTRCYPSRWALLAQTQPDTSADWSLVKHGLFLPAQVPPKEHRGCPHCSLNSLAWCQHL